MTDRTVVKLDANTLRYLTLFEDFTGTKIVDCVDKQDRLIFIVKERQLPLALRRGNIAKLKSMFKKNIDIIEFSADLPTFIKNIFHNSRVKDISIENNVVRVRVERIDKAKTIGKGSRNLHLAKEIVNRHFNVERIIIS